jgi:hypothetical protein
MQATQTDVFPFRKSGLDAFLHSAAKTLLDGRKGNAAGDRFSTRRSFGQACSSRSRPSASMFSPKTFPGGLSRPELSRKKRRASRSPDIEAGKACSLAGQKYLQVPLRKDVITQSHGIVASIVRYLA